MRLLLRIFLIISLYIFFIVLIGELVIKLDSYLLKLKEEIKNLLLLIIWIFIYCFSFFVIYIIDYFIFEKLFPDSKKETISETNFNINSSIQPTKQEIINPVLSKAPELTQETKIKEVIQFKKERDPNFSKLVKQAYQYKCAVCNQQIFDLEGNPEVEAAHIYPKALDGVDDIRNGIALCKFHHWAFDSGLFSLTDELKIIISSKIKDNLNYETLIKHEGNTINLPIDDKLKPHPIFLKAHRNIYNFQS